MGEKPCTICTQKQKLDYNQGGAGKNASGPPLQNTQAAKTTAAAAA